MNFNKIIDRKLKKNNLNYCKSYIIKNFIRRIFLSTYLLFLNGLSQGFKFLLNDIIIAEFNENYRLENFEDLFCIKRFFLNF